MSLNLLFTNTTLTLVDDQVFNFGNLVPIFTDGHSQMVMYLFSGLQSNILRFLFFTLNIFLTSTAGTSVALLMSASFNNHSVATILTALVWVLMMIFSGLLVNINTISPVLRWLKWTSIFRYSMNVRLQLTVKKFVFFSCTAFTSGATYLVTMVSVHWYG